jgi:anti-sigma-K factor RskA
MTCDELRGNYEFYAMGVLEDPERSEIREHLGRGCEVCMAGMREAREVVAMLAETAPAAAPSPRLRRRILASVGVERSRWWTVPVWAGVSLCFLAAALYYHGREQARGIEIARVRDQFREQSAEVARLTEARARLNEILSLLNQPETRQVTFGAGEPKPPRGKVFVHPTQGVLLLASNLPPAPAGKIYEMWIIPKGGKPAPAGLFQSAPDGTATHLQAGPINVAATGAVAVTLEPAGGVPQPTTTPLIVAAL